MTGKSKRMGLFCDEEGKEALVVRYKYVVIDERQLICSTIERKWNIEIKNKRVETH